MSWRRNELVENAKYGYFDFGIRPATMPLSLQGTQ
jgi:hypothetical protein